MSTEVLSPIFSYFSPLVRVADEPSEALRLESIDSGTAMRHPSVQAALHVVIGALTFVVLLLPSLLLILITGELMKRGMASPTIISLLRSTANVLAAIDLVLFLLYAFRSVLRAILTV